MLLKISERDRDGLPLEPLALAPRSLLGFASMQIRRGKSQGGDAYARPMVLLRAIGLSALAALAGCGEPGSDSAWGRPKGPCGSPDPDDHIQIIYTATDVSGAWCPEEIAYDEYWDEASIIPHRCQPVSDLGCDAEMICSLPDRLGVMRQTTIVMSGTEGGAWTAEIDMGEDYWGTNVCAGEYDVSFAPVES
jgi:hypothetical protein